MLAETDKAIETETNLTNLLGFSPAKNLYMGGQYNNMPKTAQTLIIKLRENSVRGETSNSAMQAQERELSASYFCEDIKTA